MTTIAFPEKCRLADAPRQVTAYLAVYRSAPVIIPRAAVTWPASFRHRAPFSFAVDSAGEGLCMGSTCRDQRGIRYDFAHRYSTSSTASTMRMLPAQMAAVPYNTVQQQISVSDGSEHCLLFDYSGLSSALVHDVNRCVSDDHILRVPCNAQSWMSLDANRLAGRGCG